MAAPRSSSPIVPSRRPVQSVGTRRNGVDLSALGQTSFLCEGEDARLTGMTRSPLRRLMGLNLPGAPGSATRRPAAIPRVA